MNIKKPILKKIIKESDETQDINLCDQIIALLSNIDVRAIDQILARKNIHLAIEAAKKLKAREEAENTSPQKDTDWHLDQPQHRESFVPYERKHFKESVVQRDIVIHSDINPYPEQMDEFLAVNGYDPTLWSALSIEPDETNEGWYVTVGLKPIDLSKVREFENDDDMDLEDYL